MLCSQINIAGRIKMKKPALFLLSLFLLISLAFTNVSNIDQNILKTALPTPSTDSTIPADYSAYAVSKDKAVGYLESVLTQDAGVIYIYKDFSDAANYFTQKAKIDDGNAAYVYDMDENWQDDPYAGSSAIKARVKTVGSSWGGWLFINGYLPKNESQPHLSFGEVPGAGIDLSGANTLVFAAKGAKGGEVVEFFTAGLGYDGQTNRPLEDYPDSSPKISLGFVTLTDQWRTYRIKLNAADLSSIGCGFGFVLSGNKSGDADSVFYLDEIRFEGAIRWLANAPRLLKSYETDVNSNPEQLYIQNAAFSYDNALAALALMSDNHPEEARRILDAFVFAVQNDRYKPDRVRNAYSYGDIRPFAGWQSGARLPGWYDLQQKTYFEDRYQVGSNVGNTSFVALALLQYEYLYGGEIYLQTARTLMDWVLENCGDANSPGFTAGYDGWPENDGSHLYRFTYKSSEHNIDAYAAFKQLYDLTGESKYRDAAENARRFIVSMYDEEQGYFYTGTGDDGRTPSKDNIVLDAQVWTLLSLGTEAYRPYEKALDSAINMRTAGGGYPFHAANNNGGWWAEGTAFTALGLRAYGHDADARAALDALVNIQRKDGAFPAATVKKLTTGFNLFTGEAWTYSDSAHIAPAAWYVMAVNGFNPYSFVH